jgi:hypothetical protein
MYLPDNMASHLMSWLYSAMNDSNAKLMYTEKALSGRKIILVHIYFYLKKGSIHSFIHPSISAGLG